MNQEIRNQLSAQASKRLYQCDHFDCSVYSASGKWIIVFKVQVKSES